MNFFLYGNTWTVLCSRTIPHAGCLSATYIRDLQTRQQWKRIAGTGPCVCFGLSNLPILWTWMEFKGLRLCWYSSRTAVAFSGKNRAQARRDWEGLYWLWDGRPFRALLLALAFVPLVGSLSKTLHAWKVVSKFLFPLQRCPFPLLAFETAKYRFISHPATLSYRSLAAAFQCVD